MTTAKRAIAKEAPRPKGRPVAALQSTPEIIEDILEVATTEFANKGLTGARINEIADSMRTSKRMIYYYFGGKEQLYLAVLENAFRRVREAESQLHLDEAAPEEAMRALVRFRFDYHDQNPQFVRLVMNENMQDGRFLAQLQPGATLNSQALKVIEGVYQRGCKSGVFRRGIQPFDIHLLISSLSFYSVSNRHTFSINFQRDLSAPEEVKRRRANVVEMVLRFLRA
jgi:AcrR family transcriptional regulator